MSSSISWDDTEQLKELFMGKSVKKVYSDKLLLSDGTLLTIEPNSGCGGCSAGNYEITELNECENIITNVVIGSDGDGYDSDEHLSIFVYAENRKINLLTVSGWDNGYYGTGYWIHVQR